MKISIDLDQYINTGGKLENLDLSTTRTTYFDENLETHIILITHTKVKDAFVVFFKNGRSHRYAGIWIKTEVNFILDSKYTL